jgi:hypothetical protein
MEVIIQHNYTKSNYQYICDKWDWNIKGKMHTYILFFNYYYLY